MNSRLTWPAYTLLLLLTVTSLKPQTLAGRPVLQGFDPVSFYEQGGPVAGVPKYEAVWNGRLWYFKNLVNQVRFQSSPAEFAPQFMGYCPVEFANGRRIPGKAAVYEIYEDKLYVFSDRSALMLWQRGRAVMQSRAYNRWLKQQNESQ
jgi:hypothetical protein